MEVPEVRRRVRAAIEQARRRAAERRARSEDTSRAYERFLGEVAVPVFQIFAAALVAEGHRFKVSTPAGSVRLFAEHFPADYIEVTLDADRQTPAAVARVARGRGRRLTEHERILAEGPAVASLTDADVVEMHVDEIIPFVER
jgi:hypothetical protein